MKDRARTGFELVTLTGEAASLATRDPDVTFDRQVLVGRYPVNPDAINAVGVPALLGTLDQGQVVVVDEIGRWRSCRRTFAKRPRAAHRGMRCK